MVLCLRDRRHRSLLCVTLIRWLQQATHQCAGYVAPGNKYKDLPTISMLVVSALVKPALQPGRRPPSGNETTW